MRNLSITFFVIIVLHLVVGVGGANALPQCTDPSFRHNCEDNVTYPIGHKYRGAFKNGKRHGQGTFINRDGYKYVGAFKNGNHHGQGILIHPDGSIWEIIYEEGIPQSTKKLSASRKSIAEKEIDKLRGSSKNHKKDNVSVDRYAICFMALNNDRCAWSASAS